MTTTNEQSGGAQTDLAGGSDQAQHQDQTNEIEAGKKTVPIEDLERALKDLHRFKSQAKQQEEAIRETERKLQAVEQQRLAEKEDWKALAEKRQALLDEAQARHESLKSSVFNTAKFSAVRAEALKAGLRPEAESDLELIQMDPVVVEMTTTGKMQTIGAKEFVDELKRTRAHWFKNPNVPQVNAGGRAFTGANGTVTAKDVIAAEREWHKTKTPAAEQAYKSALMDYRKNRNLKQ